MKLYLFFFSYAGCLASLRTTSYAEQANEMNPHFVDKM